MQSAQLIYLQTIEALLEDNEIDKALDALLDLDKKTQAGIREDIILQAGNHKQASQMFSRQLISFDDFSRASAKTRFGLLEIMKDIPERLDRDAKIRSVNTYQFTVPDDVRLEKVIGGQNNLLKINWLEKALRAAKAVCRVVCDDGNLGTGFLTKEGYIFTNNHVLKDIATAKSARIEFNYEVDSSGSVKTRTSYKLDTTDFISSTPDQFDFAKVRVIDNPSQPLSQWGFVEFDTSAIPTVSESVTIIPKGEDKQIALNANEVVSVWDKYLFYTTDTEPGSSGSPVFNKDWKVVAIHHAGKTDAEGGVQINARGDKRGANRGILFTNIFDFIANNPQKSNNSTGKTDVKKPTKPPKSTKTKTTEQESFKKPEKPVKPATTSDKPKPTKPTPTTPTVNTPAKPVLVQPMTPQIEAKPKPVFNPIPKFVILYDINDSMAAKTLSKHLAILKFTKKLRLYDVHSDLKPGEDMHVRINEELMDAKFAVCLITPNFANDEIIFGITLSLPKGVALIPLKIEKTNLDGTGIEKLKSLPSLGRAVSDFNNTEAGFADIAENLKKLL
jgi:V8-like Glu-specific endopeptidase